MWDGVTVEHVTIPRVAATTLEADLAAPVLDHVVGTVPWAEEITVCYVGHFGGYRQFKTNWDNNLGLKSKHMQSNIELRNTSIEFNTTQAAEAQDVGRMIGGILELSIRRDSYTIQRTIGL